MPANLPDAKRSPENRWWRALGCRLYSRPGPRFSITIVPPCPGARLPQSSGQTVHLVPSLLEALTRLAPFSSSPSPSNPMAASWLAQCRGPAPAAGPLYLLCPPPAMALPPGGHVGPRELFGETSSDHPVYTMPLVYSPPRLSASWSCLVHFRCSFPRGLFVSPRRM